MSASKKNFNIFYIVAWSLLCILMVGYFLILNQAKFEFVTSPHMEIVESGVIITAEIKNVTDKQIVVSLCFKFFDCGGFPFREVFSKIVFLESGQTAKIVIYSALKDTSILAAFRFAYPRYYK